jgi:hypothetical protein
MPFQWPIGSVVPYVRSSSASYSVRNTGSLALGTVLFFEVFGHAKQLYSMMNARLTVIAMIAS